MKKPGRPSAASLAIVRIEPPPPPPRDDHPDAPLHLSDDAKGWWHSVVRDFDLEPHHLRLLQAACEAWDRCQQARQSLVDHGALTFTDGSGNIKAHPAVSMERDARTLFARLVRELDLDATGPAESRRPPSILSNRRPSDAR